MRTKIALLKFFAAGAALLAVAALVVFFILGDIFGRIYFFGALLSIPFGLGAMALRRQLEQCKEIERLRREWGKPVRRQRNFSEIGFYFTAAGVEPDKIRVDDVTCNDLDLPELFSLLDRTLTRPGQAVLYSFLRAPCTAASSRELLRRHQVAELLQQDPKLRERLQLLLVKMGQAKTNSLAHLLWEELPAKPPGAVVFTLLALAALLVLPLPFLLGSSYALLPLVMFALNSAVHYKLRNRYTHQIEAIADLAGLLHTAKEITAANLPGLAAEQEQIRTPFSRAKPILPKLRLLGTDGAGAGSDLYVLLEYIKILFLVDIRSYFSILANLRQHREELRALYRHVGALDALLAVACYRHNLVYTKPSLVNDGALLEAVALRHPLLANPVANSLRIKEKGILITGSNMAGKSTFLRTLGLAVILAQSICTCLADSYRASYLQPASSINKRDDITGNKSLYYAEAERIRTIITPSFRDLPGLCLIDELLSGTNYGERVAASKAILNYLAQKNALVVVATHDLDLADTLQDKYACYHFSDRAGDKDLDFDYTLKPGVATTQNAIKLLEHLGYPPAIISEASANPFSGKPRQLPWSPPGDGGAK